MTALELRAELLSELNPIFDSKPLMQEVIDFVKGLSFKKKAKAKDVEPMCDTDEEIEANLRQAFKEFKEYKAGKRQTRDFFEVVNEL